MSRGQDFSVSCRYHLLSLIASRRAMLRCNFSTSLTITLKTRCLKFTFKVSFFRQSERSELSLFSKKYLNFRAKFIRTVKCIVPTLSKINLGETFLVTFKTLCIIIFSPFFLFTFRRFFWGLPSPHNLSSL